MNTAKLKELLERVRKGELEIKEAVEILKTLPYENLGYARVDHHRELRLGFPEVVFGKGKTPEELIGIIRSMKSKESNILITKLPPETGKILKREFSEGTYNKEAGAFYIVLHPAKPKGKVLVVSAGTSDIPVAEEAAVTAEVMGTQVERLYDIGIAGIHRVFDNRDKFEDATVIIVVAGMEGALPSVIGGLFPKPVIAVPTSVGYGASFEGLSALLGMLNSCAPGVAVVNIDNGFGAGYIASLIVRASVEEK